MSDAIIDTNVLLVASAAHGSSPFSDTHLTPHDCLRVLEWLQAFHASEEKVVLDNGFRIHEEYNRKMTGQDYGMLVINDKLQQSGGVRLHDIDHDNDGHAIVPVGFHALDRSDRKFLAVALADLDAGHSSEIVNATDTDDWNAISAPCAVHGVRIHHLLER